MLLQLIILCCGGVEIIDDVAAGKRDDGFPPHIANPLEATLPAI